MSNVFTRHPRRMDLSYLAHFLQALRFSGTMLLAGIICLLHAIFPFIFTFTASRIILKLSEEFEEIHRQMEGKNI